MVEIITYSLRNNQTNSNQYYRDVAGFADHVIEHGRRTTGTTINRFQDHLQRTNLEPLRSEPEYIFEYLLLGMLFRLYAAEAIQLAQPTQKILAWLYRIRSNYSILKPAADFFRGIFSGLLISPLSGSPLPPFSLESLAELLKWMEATGEFFEEVKRLELWASFLGSLSGKEQTDILKMAVSLADWFTTESERGLGRFTPNVDTFLVEKLPAYQWREDKFFCGRKREEYHLNMVGTEILNRSFREDFLAADSKIVLLPPCMKAHQDNTCQATETPFGDQCGHCTPSCRVHQTTQLGEKHGFKVLIIPHELSVFSSGKIKAPVETTIGIVGVSCPITNVTGGWETKNLGIPAQGVLLDYCGCQWHWHPNGISTDLNLKQLLITIGG